MQKNDIWILIDSYFTTIQKNLVKHQLDSYNMFIMNQLPKTVRQFNPITMMYDNKTKIVVIIG